MEYVQNLVEIGSISLLSSVERRLVRGSNLRSLYTVETFTGFSTHVILIVLLARSYL